MCIRHAAAFPHLPEHVACLQQTIDSTVAVCFVNRRLFLCADLSRHRVSALMWLYEELQHDAAMQADKYKTIADEHEEQLRDTDMSFDVKQAATKGKKEQQDKSDMLVNQIEVVSLLKVQGKWRMLLFTHKSDVQSWWF